MPDSLSDRAVRWWRLRAFERMQRLRNRKYDFDFAHVRDELIVYHHLGLGDHFICMGLVLSVARRFSRGPVQLPVKSDYVPTVAALYSRFPHVRIFPVERASVERSVYALARRRGTRVARIGFGAHDPLRWDRSYYEQAGVPFEESWTAFDTGDADAAAAALFQRIAPRTPYQLVHAEGSVGGFNLDLPAFAHRIYVRPERGPGGLLAWLEIIRRASEIHCVDSSVVHLVDRLPHQPEQGLFLHDARGSGCVFARRRPWTLVGYPRAMTR